MGLVGSGGGHRGTSRPTIRGCGSAWENSNSAHELRLDGETSCSARNSLRQSAQHPLEDLGGRNELTLFLSLAAAVRNVNIVMGSNVAMQSRPSVTNYLWSAWQNYSSRTRREEWVRREQESNLLIFDHESDQTWWQWSLKMAKLCKIGKIKRSARVREVLCVYRNFCHPDGPLESRVGNSGQRGIPCRPQVSGTARPRWYR